MIKILKFESDSCPQCKALSATLERITKEYKTDMKSIDIEEDNNHDLVRKYNIRTVVNNASVLKICLFYY